MRRILFSLLTVVLALFVVAPAALAQGGRQRSLLVTATDAKGTPVDTLSAEDVVVREDGMAREVLKVSRPADPVDITLLVDNSLAATRALQDIRLGLEKFVTMFAGPHTITLMTMADRPTVQVKATTSKAQLLRGVKRLFAQPDSGAYMVESIIDASREIAKRKPGRAVILAITSFGTEFSDRGFQFALEALADSGATLHVIELQDTVNANPSDQNVRDRSSVIDRGTTETGGTRDLLVANLSLTDALQKMGRLATSQFEVVYGRPDTLLPARKVDVTAARPTLKLRANVLQANRAGR
jgi:hypothetical protein